MVVLKEIINNALLHGKAQHIDLNIIDHQDELSIIIEDDGVGFDVNSEKLGVGLSNIKHRIKSIDGTVNVDSMIGTGTVFNLNICKNENISC